MPPDQTPKRQPITALPMIGSLIDEMLANAEEHYATIQQARGRPYVLDDAIVERIIQVHTDQLEDHWLFEQQLSREAKQPPMADQRFCDSLSPVIYSIRSSTGHALTEHQIM